MRWLLASSATLVAILSYIVFGHWLRNVARDWAAFRAMWFERPAECVAHVGLFFFATALLIAAAILVGRRRPSA